MSSGDNPMAVHFTSEELDAAVDESRRLGRDVMAHAHSAAGIRAALEAGVRSIEHATMIDESCIELMKKRNSDPADPRGECWIVPTLFIGEYYALKESEGALTAPGKLTTLRDDTENEHLRCLARAVQLGLADRICLGSDYVGWKVELNERELECLVHRIGLTPFEAIKAATINPAKMLRLEQKIGSIKPGKIADLVAIHGDPSIRIENMRNLAGVIHLGELV